MEALSRRAVEQDLSYSWWQALSQEWNPTVKTNLRKLGSGTTARLIFHGYVAALAHTTTSLGWTPPMHLPRLADIETWCAADADDVDCWAELDEE